MQKAERLLTALDREENFREGFRRILTRPITL
jgi:predicted transcriptional regulator